MTNVERYQSHVFNCRVCKDALRTVAGDSSKVNRRSKLCRRGRKLYDRAVDSHEAAQRRSFPNDDAS